MKRTFRFDFVEKSIAQDRKFLYTIVSFLVILAIFINLFTIQSPLIGLTASTIYFLTNTVFLGNAFFQKENVFFRLMFGILLLIMLLGLVSWLVLIMYNLDAIRCTLVLGVVSTISSLLNRRMRHRDVPK